MATDSVEDIKRQLQEWERQQQMLLQKLEQARQQEAINAASLLSSSALPKQTSGDSSRRANMAPRSMSSMGPGRRIETKMMRSQTSQVIGNMPRMSKSTSMSSDEVFEPSNSSPQFSDFGAPMLQRFCEDEPANISMRSINEVGMDPRDFFAACQDYSIGGMDVSTQTLAPNSNMFDITPTSLSVSVPSLASGESSFGASSPLTTPSTTIDATMMESVDLGPHCGSSHVAPQLERYHSQEGYLSSQMSPTGSKSPFDAGALLHIGGAVSDVYPSASSMGREPSTLSSLIDMEKTAEMSRTRSNESNCSTSSGRSTASNQERRAREAHERHMRNAERTLLRPKPATSESADSSMPASSSKKDGKVALNKTPYQRKPPTKMFCEQCQDHPDGFRGRHELDRHVQAKHSVVIKRWIARDPGFRTKIMPVVPLSDCKSCQARKQYGAYYNVGAHLRRTHFNKEKLPRGAKGKKPRMENGKSDGTQANNWPPMDILKQWMTSIQVDKEGKEASEAIKMEEEAPLDPSDSFNFDQPMDLSPQGYSSPDDNPFPLTPQATADISFADMAEGVFASNSNRCAIPAYLSPDVFPMDLTT